MNNPAEDLLNQLRKAEDEEGADLYLLQLYLNSHQDLKFFTEPERKRIQNILSVLIDDTEKHHAMLSNIAHDIEKGLKGPKKT